MRRWLQPLLLLSLLAGLWPAAIHAREESLNERVFDKAWTLVGERYWDRTMGGNDWDAIRARYYPQAMAARGEKQLYAVVNKMLDQLDDSHVYATAPSDINWSGEPGDDVDQPTARRVTRLEGGVLLLTFNQFDPGDDRWIARSIAETPDLRGVILDLRGNGGGRDDVLDKVAGLFTQRRELLIRLTGKKVIEEKTRGAGPDSYRGPLALIVGPNTASAAEILAFFLGESGRAFTVGERSAGAVTGGVDYKLPGGGQLTVAEYDIRTANGTRLEGNGFTPKYRVSSARKPRDAALEKAVALVRSARS
ncbi:MAG: peptidase S41 [Sphingomonadales bacterium]|nr:MAG: peptidase S41 [Sphingomonadales bacterium]